MNIRFIIFHFLNRKKFIFLVVIFQNDIYLRINKAKKIVLFIYIVKMICYVSSWIY